MVLVVGWTRRNGTGGGGGGQKFVYIEGNVVLLFTRN